MAHLVNIKIGKKTIKIVNQRKTLFSVSDEIQTALDERFVCNIKKLLAKQKKKIKINESLKLINSSIPNKEKVLKKNIKNAFEEFVMKLCMEQ